MFQKKNLARVNLTASQVLQNLFLTDSTLALFENRNPTNRFAIPEPQSRFYPTQNSPMGVLSDVKIAEFVAGFDEFLNVTFCKCCG